MSADRPIDAITRAFARCREEGRGALMPFITGGDPSLTATSDLLAALPAAGADLIEVGIPFSDPIADGPVIAASMHAALERGVTPGAVFEAIRAGRAGHDAPILAMVSSSIVHRRDAAEFAAEAAEHGVNGLIVPDADLDAADRLRAGADAAGIGLTLLVAPTTHPDRIRSIVQACSGFVYVLARVGLTGEQSSAPEIDRLVADVREQTDLPVAAGFGISTAEHVRAVHGVADGAIVGSALVRRLDASDDPVATARAFMSELQG